MNENFSRAAKARLGFESWKPQDKKNEEWWTRPVHRYGEFRGLQAQADLRQAAAEVNLRDEVRRYGRAEITKF